MDILTIGVSAITVLEALTKLYKTLSNCAKRMAHAAAEVAELASQILEFKNLLSMFEETYNNLSEAVRNSMNPFRIAECMFEGAKKVIDGFKQLSRNLKPLHRPKASREFRKKFASYVARFRWSRMTATVSLLRVSLMSSKSSLSLLGSLMVLKNAEEEKRELLARNGDKRKIRLLIQKCKNLKTQVEDERKRADLFGEKFVQLQTQVAAERATMPILPKADHIVKISIRIASQELKDDYNSRLEQILTGNGTRRVPRRRESHQRTFVMDESRGREGPTLLFNSHNARTATTDFSSADSGTPHPETGSETSVTTNSSISSAPMNIAAPTIIRATSISPMPPEPTQIVSMRSRATQSSHPQVAHDMTADGTWAFENPSSHGVIRTSGRGKSHKTTIRGENGEIHQWTEDHSDHSD